VAFVRLRVTSDYLSPRPVPFCQELSSSVGRRAVTAGSEVIAHRTERPRKTLCLLWRLEPPHGSFTLTCRLVGVLRTVIQTLVPSMLSCRQHSSDGWPVARKLIGDHHPRLGAGCRQHTP
jgi:hypothetical protein